jgi:hypothetical protein
VFVIEQNDENAIAPTPEDEIGDDRVANDAIVVLCAR